MGLIDNVNVQVSGSADLLSTLQTYVTKILKPNIVDGKNILTQEMVSAKNTKYVIKYDYELAEDITIPENCVLEFEGGSISAGNGQNMDTIAGVSTAINAGFVKIFNTNVTLNGDWNVEEWYTEWFGAKADHVTDSTLMMQKTIDTVGYMGGGTIKLLKGIYMCSSLDFTHVTNIALVGVCSAVAPYKVQTQIKANSASDFLIQIVGDYNDQSEIPSVFGREIILENLFLNGNNLSNNGVNMSMRVTMDKCFVRNCVVDGIVFENGTYPVKLRDTESANNGRYGLYIKPLWTTCYEISNVECNSNGSYGAYICGGTCCTITNLRAQRNKGGGLKIEQKPSVGSIRSWLGNLSINSLYTEANGTTETDPNYDGNYALVIKGLQADEFNINKINKILISNSCINKIELDPSEGITTSEFFKIEGTSGLVIVNTTNIYGSSIDYSKNVTPELNSFAVNKIRLGEPQSISGKDVYTIGLYSGNDFTDIFKITDQVASITVPLTKGTNGNFKLTSCGDSLMLFTFIKFDKPEVIGTRHVTFNPNPDNINCFYPSPDNYYAGEFVIWYDTTIIKGLLFGKQNRYTFRPYESLDSPILWNDLPATGINMQISTYPGILYCANGFIPRKLLNDE